MIQARVYDFLKGRPWTTTRQIAARTGIATASVAHALQGLKKRGAVEREGRANLARWRQVPGHDVYDRRVHNGVHGWQPGVSGYVGPAVKAPPTVPAKPVFASPLTQALAWEP